MGIVADAGPYMKYLDLVRGCVSMCLEVFGSGREEMRRRTTTLRIASSRDLNVKLLKSH